MCGVIGVYGKASEEVLFYTKRLFEQSQIRGKHATGLSFLEDGILHTIQAPVPSKEFAKSFDFSLLPDDIKLIGHCRYSTSDLRDNQPIFNHNISIVHNGVISQESPDLWLRDFGYSCKTRNDSELILKCIEAGEEPIDVFCDKSVAAIVINGEEFYFFRNGNRPLWFTMFKENYFIASTRDILLRTFGQEQGYHKCIAGIIYSIVGNQLIYSIPETNWVDIQTETDCADYYERL